MELTWFELRLLGMEISSVLRSNYVNNVYPLGPCSYTVRFRNPDGAQSLLIVLRKAAWLSDKAPKIAVHDSFIDSLRKEIVRCRFESAAAIEGERILEVSLLCRGHKKRMYIEFFGAGNTIVVNDKEEITAACRELKGKKRSISVGSQYVLPERKKLVFAASDDEIKAVFSYGKTDVARAIGKKFLVPRKYLDEIFFRSETKGNQILRVEDFLRSLRSVHKEIQDSNTIFVYYKDNGGEVVEISVIRLKSLEALGYKAQQYSSPSRAFAKAFGNELKETILESLRGARYLSEIKRLESELKRQRQHLADLKNMSEKLRGLASSLISGLLPARKAVEEAAKVHGSIRVTGDFVLFDEEKISLDRPGAIASRIFDLAKKLENAMVSIEDRINKTQDKLLRLKDEALKLATKEEYEARAGYRKWYEKYRWFYTSEGFLAVGGKDASSNAAIIKRYTEPDDLVFHAEIHGSPFFVLKKGKKGAGQQSLNEVAQAVTSFSRAWREGLAAADAYYVSPEQVSQKAPSGEYLPPGSFMVRGPRNYVRGLKLRLGVGVVVDPSDGEYKLCSGPPSAIEEHGFFYVLIEPGHLKSSEAAQKIARILAEHTPEEILERTVEKTSADAIQRLIPPGNSRIVGMGRGKRLRT